MGPMFMITYWRLGRGASMGVPCSQEIRRWEIFLKICLVCFFIFKGRRLLCLVNIRPQRCHSGALGLSHTGPRGRFGKHFWLSAPPWRNLTASKWLNDVLASAAHIPNGLRMKNPPANAGDVRDAASVLRSGKSPGVGNGNPLQCSHLEKSMGRGAWWATVHGAAENRTRLSHWAHEEIQRWGDQNYFSLYRIGF